MTVSVFLDHPSPSSLATQRPVIPGQNQQLLPGRVTYVIDREGIVRHVFNSQFAADRHVKESLDAIRKMSE